MGAWPDRPHLPPYRQIADDIRNAIAAGEIEPGGQISSNNALRDQYGVAGQTAQNAVNALRAEGLVYGVPGRGVYVKRDIDIEALAVSSGDPITQILDRLDTLTSQVEALTQRVQKLEEA